MIFYFSATGNSKYVSKCLSNKCVFINEKIFSLKKSYSDEKIGVVFPCYAFNIPKIVERFFDEIDLHAKYLFCIVTYGDDAAGVVGILKKIAKRNKLKFDYIKTIKMVQNYLLGYDMKVEKKKVNWSDVNCRVEQIKRDINFNKSYCDSFTKVMYIKSLFYYTLIKFGYILSDYEDKYFYTTNCLLCEKCISICPKENIYIDEYQISFRHNCEVCYACLHQCPYGALHIQDEINGERYFNPLI